MMNSDMSETRPNASPDKPVAKHASEHPGNASDAPAAAMPLPGWTRLLVFVFMIGSPAFDILYFASQLHRYENLPFGLALPDSFALYRSLGWSVVILSSLISFLAGLCLWKKRKWSSVRFAKWALWLTGPLYVLVRHILDFFFLFNPSGFYRGPESIVPIMYMLFGYLLLPMAQSLVWAIGWTIYLGKSQRVRQTFGGESAAGQLPYTGNIPGNPEYGGKDGK
ncbi:hypothetical protein OFAG_00853 [Oxalobacter formigenes HOxBLS]|uniref:DUF2569 domain-containing protein n=2 Tax=Oxalobacter paraformigenes TaxID=556268 RepID=C3X3B4_9BURK|nr:hypothetical protein [Oxalobacter paraformigenes]EEO27700.2 hypothetical protein OFAG_00853 [Oxalobacter paraformigenes]